MIVDIADSITGSLISLKKMVERAGLHSSCGEDLHFHGSCQGSFLGLVMNHEPLSRLSAGNTDQGFRL